MSGDRGAAERGLRAWFEEAAPDELLPARRRDVPVLSSVTHLDSLSLTRGIELMVGTAADAHVVVPAVDGVTGPRRAAAGDGAFAAMLRAMHDERHAGAFRGSTYAERHHEAADDGEIAIDVDQSNDSVVVGDSAVVKLFPLAPSGPRPGLDLPLHLSRVGDAEIAPPIGALHWTAPAGDVVVLATATAYLPGATDGWTWYLDLLLDSLDGDGGDDLAFEPAPTLGQLAARMHAGLATSSEVLLQPVREAGATTARRRWHAANAVLDDALACTTGQRGERLRARTDAIRAELARLAEIVGGALIRVHGDFHVGQVLRWSGGYAVVDFDGNPLAPGGEQGGFDTAVRDVASFVRSIDHVGRVASSRRGGRDSDVERWIERSREGFLDAYVHELDALGHAQLFDPALLRPLEVAQECHEYVYAARFLPRWGYVPDLALRAMFPGPDH